MMAMKLRGVRLVSNGCWSLLKAVSADRRYLEVESSAVPAAFVIGQAWRLVGVDHLVGRRLFV